MPRSDGVPSQLQRKAISCKICREHQARTTKRHLSMQKVCTIPSPRLGFEHSLTLQTEWFIKARDVARSDTLTIYCSDNFLRYRGNHGRGKRWNDEKYGNFAAVLPTSKSSTDHACGGELAAIAYSPPNGYRVIVLCSDWAQGAGKLIRSPTFGNTRGGRSARGWRYSTLADGSKGDSVASLPPGEGGFGIQIFGLYLSYHLLHELMHTASELQCRPRINHFARLC